MITNTTKSFLLTRFAMLLACILCSTVTYANDDVAMADVMRSNGKIYIVVAVCLTILIGLFLYVFSVDRKIAKIEKEQ
jgi:CcmD family protein